MAKMLKIIQNLSRGRVTPKEATNWRIEREKKRITRNEYQRLFNYFDTEGNGTKMPMELGKGEYHEGKR